MGEILNQLSQITINDMLLEVRAIWFTIDKDSNKLELDLVPVC